MSRVVAPFLVQLCWPLGLALLAASVPVTAMAQAQGRPQAPSQPQAPAPVQSPAPAQADAPGAAPAPAGDDASRNAARSRLHECGHQWSLMKASGKAAGMTWKDYSRGCLTKS